MGAKAKYDIAPIIRNGFIVGLRKYCADNNKTIPEVFADWLEKDGVGNVLGIVAKYSIREANISGSVELNHTFGDVSQTLGFLERNLGIGTDNPSEESMQNQSLLPPPVRTQ